jgi:hypothetical protein
MSKPIQAIGVGSPAIFYLHEFGRLVQKVFGKYPVLVGSALKHKNPRDIDVRVELNRAEFVELFGDPSFCKGASRYAVMCMAFSALGEKLTGLPIDFQVQYPGWSNQNFGRPKLELGRDEAIVDQAG